MMKSMENGGGPGFRFRSVRSGRSGFGSRTYGRVSPALVALGGQPLEGAFHLELDVLGREAARHLTAK